MHAAITAWEPDDFKAWLRLSLTAGVGHRTALRLLKHFGLPAEIFQASAQELQTCVTAAQAQSLRRLPEHFEAAFDGAWQWLQSSTAVCAHAVIALGDPRYPSSLLHIPDPPPLLYVRGAPQWVNRPAPLCDWGSSIAIVGSRNPTPQGADNAYQFASYLAGQGWCVVSGMALGIDASAHHGALAGACAHLPTIAVVGTGIDRIYPPSHQALAQQLAVNALILSEFPLGTAPMASNFPKRNRIISGLTRGTLVVEAALASGSLITARAAAEQGREIFAIPGSIHNPLARGCHSLIQQGAKLVQSAQDILEELKPSQAAPEIDHTLNTATCSPCEEPAGSHPLLHAMGYDPIHLDSLCARTGWDAAHLQAQLLELELAGCVLRLPGGRFQRSSVA